MPRRTRTAKKLAQRIDLNYFKRSHSFRRWRLILGTLAVGVAGGWLLWYAAAGEYQPYSSGPIASSHALFGQRCELCHLDRGFRQSVADEACLACHDAPAHREDQAYTPTCGSCHVEHAGAEHRLARTRDRVCTACHGDLRTTAGPSTRLARRVTEFRGDHPEFAGLAGGDGGTLEFNHRTHLKAGIVGPDGPLQLACADCHRTAAGGLVVAAGASDGPGSSAASAVPAAPAASTVSAGPTALSTGALGAAVATAAMSTSPVAWSPALARGEATGLVRDRYMAPISFQQHCARCHQLKFDERFGDDEVPHEPPEVVRAFMQQRFAGYIAEQPAALRTTLDLKHRRATGEETYLRVADSSQWVALQVDEAERLLARKTCAQCHAVQIESESIYRVVSTAVTPRWLEMARFDHRPHQFLTCDGCHAAAASERTADLLVPGIANCRGCHRHGKAAAEDGCFECHAYHDWIDEQPLPGRFAIGDLVMDGIR